MTATTSFLLLAYNSEASIAEALESALAQEGPALDIVVSDDCSTDRTFEVIQRAAALYRGPHRLRCQRQPHNLGIPGNFLSAIRQCEGDLVVLAASDDRSHPQRAQRLTEAWMSAGRPSAAVVYSDVTPIDATGAPVSGWSERVARPPWTPERLAEGRDGPLGAACAITPRLLAEPRPFGGDVRHEDRVLPLRALLLGGELLFVDRPLLDYQVVGGISRLPAGSRYDELTMNLERRLSNTLVDAKQRHADAIAANAPPALVRLCSQVIAEHEAMLAMADGRSLVRKAVAATAGGARPGKVAMHLARFGLARAELLFRSTSQKP